MIGPIPARWAPYLQSVLRIVVAFSFMTHGTQKLFAVPVAAAREPVELVSLAGLAGVLETFGGLLLLVGLFTRAVAFLLSGQMAVAYFLRHAPQGFWPIPTVARWPGVRRIVLARGEPGEEIYQICDIHFDSFDALRAALTSPERKVSQEDAKRFPAFEGQVKRQVFEVREFRV